MIVKNILHTFKVSSANTLYFDLSKIFLFGKEFNLMSTEHSLFKSMLRNTHIQYNL